MQYKIIVADSIDGYRTTISEILTKKGYKVYPASDSGTVLRIARSVYPELILLDVNLNGINAYEVAKIVENDHLSTVLFLTNRLDETFFHHLSQRNIYAYLQKPLRPSALIQTVEFSIHNALKFKNLTNTIHKLENHLEKRKIVEQAKGILMEHQNLSEAAAYQFLRKTSMDQCVNMETLARQIIETYRNE